MAFTINFYNNSSDPKSLTKNLTLTGTVSGELKEGTSIIDPTIIFQSIDVMAFNYVEIPQFGRSYFVKNITNIGKDLWQIDMHVDVLGTYKTKILACPCVCSRQENAGNMYLPDDRMPVSRKTFTTTKRIGTHAFTNDYYVLICQ